MGEPFVSNVELRAEAEATPWARRHVRDVLNAWELEKEDIDTAELAASELVSNSVHHITEAFPDIDPTRVTLTLRMEYPQLTVEVADASRRLPMINAKVPDDSESGRGLFIVASISKDWGFYQPPTGGKVVWCIIALD
jgi:anti-sigma regulatory factor (Ser/Thr protein kinase)